MFESTLRLSSPIMLAALGGLLSERSGVINIALEGLMLIGAFAGAAGALATSSPWLGIAFAMSAGAALAAIYALFVIEFRSNQIVAGTATNFLAAGLTPFLSKILYDSTTGTPSLEMGSRFHYAPVLAAWGFLFAVAFWIRFVPSGTWLLFSGESPEALEAAGIRVRTSRWLAVIGSGVLAGTGGATLSIGLSSSFSRNMTAGRGFMALAALIFGRWKPIPTAAACLLFGFSDAAQIRLQGLVLPGGQTVPVQFIQILPYVITMLALAGFMGGSRPPRALGLPLESR